MTITGILVKDTPRVMGLLAVQLKSLRRLLSAKWTKSLNRLEETVDKPTHKTIYEPGEMVRVTDGPFNDFTGTVEEVNYEKSRVELLY